MLVGATATAVVEMPSTSAGAQTAVPAELQGGELNLGATAPVSAPVSAPVMQKIISVQYTTEEDDSDQLPSQVVMENFQDLKYQLAELCGIKNIDTRNVKIILGKHP